MSQVHFKLTFDGHTRRIAFQSLPTWSELASKLVSCGIPFDRVGVSYVDTDNDEITISSNEELQDYYQTCYSNGNAIKFNLLDLSTPRGPLPQLNDFNRSIFGQESFDSVGSDWQRLQHFPEFTEHDSLGPDAFIEVADSEVSGFTKDHEEPNEEAQRQPTYVDAAKDNTQSFKHASIASVASQGPSSTPNPVVVSLQDRDQSTPIPQSNVTGKGTTDTDEAEDPPLPSIDPPPSNGSASLSRDLATLITNFSNIIASHPELSEGIRNIINNTTSGAYWETQRAALSEVVNEISHPRDQSDGDASRKLSDEIGNIFRSLSLASTSGNNVNPAPNQDNATSPSAERNEPVNPSVGPGGTPWTRRNARLNGRRPWMSNRPTFQPTYPHPIRDPLDHTPTVPFNFAPSPMQLPSFLHHVTALPEGITPGANRRPEHPRTQHHPHSSFHEPFKRNAFHTDEAWDPFSAAAQARSASYMPPSNVQENSDPPTTQQLRAKVEDAKRLYKAQKEAYRKNREERRKEKRAPDSAASFPFQATEVKELQEAAASLDELPQLEIPTIPRRFNTHPGHGPLRRKPDDLNTRAQARIARRLADMGFSEHSYPDLPEKIRAQLSSNGIMSMEGEDDVVTTLLEELLDRSTRAGPSGSKQSPNFL